MQTPAEGAGAHDPQAGGRDRGDPNPRTRKAQDARAAARASARVDELLVRLGHRLRRPGLTSFEAGFAKSLLGQARRGGPCWAPSARQLAVAERILAERDGADVVLIEPIDGGDR